MHTSRRWLWPVLSPKFPWGSWARLLHLSAARFSKGCSAADGGQLQKFTEKIDVHLSIRFFLHDYYIIEKLTFFFHSDNCWSTSICSGFEIAVSWHPQDTKMGRFRYDPHYPHMGEISAVCRGRGEKFVSDNSKCIGDPHGVGRGGG
jgi:hypothetical protein